MKKLTLGMMILMTCFTMTAKAEDIFVCEADCNPTRTPRQVVNAGALDPYTAFTQMRANCAELGKKLGEDVRLLRLGGGYIEATIRGSCYHTSTLPNR